MEKIYLDDINLSELKPVASIKHSESTLFHDGITVYKLFDDLYDEQLKRKQRKIELLGEGEPLPITIMPKSELFYMFPFERFEGFGMDYVKSETLYKKFVKNKDIDFLIKIMDIVSHSVMKIHQDPRNIVISDLHVHNIIVDNGNNPYIVDIDSCKIDGIKNDAIPMGLKLYLSNGDLFKLFDDVKTTPNTDRFCLLISVLSMIFGKSFDKISLYEYDEKAEHIEILKDMRKIMIELKLSSIIPEVPYFHEFIKKEDSFTRKLTK